MAAALIDRQVHHCHLVTRGNSYRMRSTPSSGIRSTPTRTPEPASRRRGRQEVATAEAHPLVGLSDFQSANCRILARR